MERRFIQIIREVLKQYRRFKRDIKHDDKGFYRYIQESTYYDKYSEKDVAMMRTMLAKLIRQYLHRNYPYAYIVLDNFCVVVVRIDQFVKEKTVKKYLVR